MTIVGANTRRRIIALTAGCALGGAVAATIAAPAASATTDCSASSVATTVSTVTGSARDYLNSHPGANQAVMTAFTQPDPAAANTLRSYFTANPGEYYDLRGILSP